MNSLEKFTKNLVTFAPTKAEAKKTVSRGLIRVEFKPHGSAFIVTGMATDDVVSIYDRIDLDSVYVYKILDHAALSEATNHSFIGYYSPEQLKSWEFAPKMDYVAEPPAQPFNREFDHKFWLDHVYDSIAGNATQVDVNAIAINPERLRKFSLLAPRGEKLWWSLFDWADQTIIRWYYGLVTKGVYAPLDVA